MATKSTYLRVLFLVCLVAGPAVMACEAALDFDRSKIQHYASSDGAPPEEEDAGEEPEPDPDPTPTPDAGNPDTGPRDAGRDADADTGT